jgi:hypothetical protein
MTQLIQLLADKIDDRTVSQMSRMLGTDSAKTEQAINAALPMIVGALGRNASSQQGAQSLVRALERDHDGSILGDVLGALAKPDTLQAGQAILGHVFGNKQDHVTAGVGTVSGLDAGSTAQLLAMLAPLVMGALGKAKQENHLDASGVAQLLQQDRDETEGSLGGLAQLLDLDGDGDVTDDMMVLGKSLLSGLFGRRR